MTRSGTRTRFIAWVSLLATLFSAVSPAIAATLLTDQPAALAQLLGIPAQPQASPDDEHAAHHHHDESGSKPAGAPHTTHGIYCSFCLNASSTLAVAGAPAPIVLATLASTTSIAEPQHTYTAAFHPHFRSRAPPR